VQKGSSKNGILSLLGLAYGTTLLAVVLAGDNVRGGGLTCQPLLCYWLSCCVALLLS
jgi:hypothetical protein